MDCSLTTPPLLWSILIVQRWPCIKLAIFAYLDFNFDVHHSSLDWELGYSTLQRLKLDRMVLLLKIFENKMDASVCGVDSFFSLKPPENLCSTDKCLFDVLDNAFFARYKMQQRSKLQWRGGRCCWSNYSRYYSHYSIASCTLSLSLSTKAGYGQIRPSPLLFNIFTTISGTQRIRVTEKLIIPSPQLSTQHMSGNSATRTLWSTTFTSWLCFVLFDDRVLVRWLSKSWNTYSTKNLNLLGI